ncbi:MAG: hypothetical protein II994_04450 [Lachnospiraceae bacterium]|nr:hypothetical protein [Lachnospiraceae bacterium]
MKENEGYLRVISNGVRFGCGFRMYMNDKQFFAWYGSPNRNDDYITTTEISEEEYEQICVEYSDEISADLEMADLFRKKYIEGHTVILEGWNKLLRNDII